MTKEEATNNDPDPTASALVGKLLVDFPTRRRTLRFAPRATVFPIRSTLTMIFDKRELWYSERNVEEMKLERDADAITLARTLLSPSAEDLREGGVHVSQVIGLEKAVNPTQARGKSKVVKRLGRQGLCQLLAYPRHTFAPFLNCIFLSRRRQKDRGDSQDGYCQATGCEG
jgi:hypothetical protein